MDCNGLLVVEPGVNGLVARPDSKTIELLDLIGSLFHQEWQEGESPHVSGRGAVRRLLNDWLLIWLGPMTSFDLRSAAENLLDRAEFLWHSPFDEARRHLVGAVDCSNAILDDISPDQKSAKRIVVALPSNRLFSLFSGDRVAYELALSDVDLLRSQLSGPHAAARWRQVDASGLKETSTDQRSVEEHYARGSFESVVEELKGCMSFHDRLRVAQSLYQLHQLRAAWTRVEELAREVFDSSKVDADALELADLALRLTANLELEEAQSRWRDWLASVAERACDTDDHEEAWQARLLQAWCDWDRRDRDAMERSLDAIPQHALTFAAADSPFRLSSYFQARSLLSAGKGEGGEAVAYLSRALAPIGRRRLKRFEAGRLWNDMAVARCQTDDLAGAERACRHAVRLLAGCDGPGATTLALRNLAEVCIRRGRLQGVESVIQASAAANRQAGNGRGEVEDLALHMRLDLARGEVDRALARWRTFSDPAWDDEEVLALALRALAWCGRRSEALGLLTPQDSQRRDGQVDSGFKLLQGQLESEEIVPLWLLVGRPDLAAAAWNECALRSSGPWADLLSSLVAREQGDVISASLDREVETLLYDRLEPYAAARHLYDLDLLGVSIESDTRARAAAVFDRVGAAGLARRVARGGEATWQAWARYQRAPDMTIDGLRAFFEEAGYGHVQVYACDNGRSPGEEESSRAFRRRIELPGVVGGTGSEAAVLSNRDEPGLEVLVDSLQLLFVSASRNRTGSAGRSIARPRPSDRAGLIGGSESFLDAVGRLERVGRGTGNVLILGETGTGKELAARVVHDNSPRALRDFLAVNCAALGEQNLLLAELFGHSRGAFTGAEKDRAGVFEAAHGGTVFLDEIGDLPQAAQGMLLRVLQEGEVRRLGEVRSRSIDVRVVAATHRDLRAMTHEGRFRLDLFFRLAVATVELPPLRDRGDDILQLAREFLGRIDQRLGLSHDAVEALMGYSWPGNVRELQHVIQVAAASCHEVGSTSVAGDHLELHGLAPLSGGTPTVAIAAGRGGYQQRVEDFKRALVRDALERHDGNQAAAARSLGMRRQSLWHLARKFDLV